MSQDPCDDEEDSPTAKVATVKTPESQGTTDISQDHKPLPKHSWWKNPTALNVLFNGILAITTIFLGLIAYWQYESSILEQRAWVGAYSMEMRTFEVGKPITAAITFTNTGKTPAIRTKASAVLMIGKKMTDIESFDFDREKRIITIFQSVSDLYPSSTLSVPVSVLFEENQLARVKSGEALLFIVGRITYSDVFEREHNSWVCGYYIPSTNIFSNCQKYKNPD